MTAFMKYLRLVSVLRGIDHSARGQTWKYSSLRSHPSLLPGCHTFVQRADIPHDTLSGRRYLTAPMESPRTSCRCAIQPRSTIGNTAIVHEAANFAQNSPSDVTKRTMNMGTVDSFGARLNARKNSFQAKIIEMKIVATRPGATMGSTI